MKVGISPINQRKAIAITDRKEAIKAAFLLAQPGDIILVAGKGHEKYQEIKNLFPSFPQEVIIPKGQIFFWPVMALLKTSPKMVTSVIQKKTISLE